MQDSKLLAIVSVISFDLRSSSDVTLWSRRFLTMKMNYASQRQISLSTEELRTFETIRRLIGLRVTNKDDRFAETVVSISQSLCKLRSLRTVSDLGVTTEAVSEATKFTEAVLRHGNFISGKLSHPIQFTGVAMFSRVSLRQSFSTFLFIHVPLDLSLLLYVRTPTVNLLIFFFT